MGNLDPSKFDVLPVFISKEGKWQRVSTKRGPGRTPVVEVSGSELVPMLSDGSGGRFAEITGGRVGKIFSVDVIFPVLHGTFGEDGTVQGLADLMGVACVGAGVLGSSLCMDKTVSKNILRQNGIPVVDFLGFTRDDWRRRGDEVLPAIKSVVGYPCFVKSANLGSSVGISGVESEAGVTEAVERALGFSERVIVERAVPNPREIEVSVVGNDDPVTSVPGELLLEGSFYDYSKKYKEGFSGFSIPCELNEETMERIASLAVSSYKALCCCGMARVDFLVDGNTGEVFVSELNTIPGFTSSSMYPKLWKASGVSAGQLLERLLSLAERRLGMKRRLGTDFSG